MSGQASIEFKAASVLSYSLEPGDFVYLPAGTPHRILPQTESVQLRYKAKQPGQEGVACYCSGYGAEVWREEWDTAEELPQEGYWHACWLFNTNDTQRVCGQCGADHPPVDLTGIRWPEIAAAIRTEQS